ncbi:nuclease-related domain-containing protein [Alteribacter lacisalsi]|uniref:nuclease-related domain-containing protein n=1 Tax=Alteribacter lacisalsi TaxID=2045244 RepID=UPI001374E7D0|nr:nuclease-related domain-containing protein [Alteribacter lacisalsi]
MIVKPLKRPVIIDQLEALSRRLPPRHPRYGKIVNDLGGYRSGYAGEKHLLYTLRSFAERPDLNFLHNVRLLQYGYHFETDLMILSRHQHIFLESKNFKGRLEFDGETGQFTRVDADTGERQVFRQPLLQVQSHRDDFTGWLVKQKLSAEVPIEAYAVLTHSQAFLDPASMDKSMAGRLFRSEVLPQRIQKLLGQKTGVCLTDVQLQAICDRILLMDRPLKRNVLSTYGIPQSDLITGVRCPACSQIPMLKRKTKWCCGRCGFTGNSETVLPPTMRDYALIVSEYLTKKQFMNFCHMENGPQASYYLRKQRLQMKGGTKGAVYCLSDLLK